MSNIVRRSWFAPKTWGFWWALIVCFVVFNIVGHWIELGYCIIIDSLFDTVEDHYTVRHDPWWHPYWVYGFGAVSALEADKDGGPLVFFRQNALYHLMRYDNDKTRWLARHPVAITLEEADRESGSELCETLRLYLMCNCSLAVAARKLFVHKNTVAYRIGSIRKMGLVDFDDDEDRLYALFSLLVSDTSGA